VCRDIWALHLSLLPDPPPAEPFYHAQENRTEGETGKASLETMTTKEESNLPRESEDSDDSTGSVTGDKNGKSEVEEDDDEDEVEEDPELEALMRENSELSSSSSEDEKASPIGNPRKKGKKKGHSSVESPVSTIAVLVVACWMLRIPVMLRDFTRCVFGMATICRYLYKIVHISIFSF
jgi:RNA polymerase I-specific transcription initiation factor RRN7